MRLYDKEGWLDVDNIMKNCKLTPFIFIVGARGTGKTFGFLKYVLHNNMKFLYIRRTKTQYEMANKPDANPFNALENEIPGTHITTQSLSTNLTGVFTAEYDDEKEKYVPTGDCLGYMSALSIFSNLRGVSFDDVDIVIYDEFIPEAHERKMKQECSALLNMLETIGRNRELKGRKPLMLVCLANANDLCNPYFVGLGITKPAEQMAKEHKSFKQFVDRGISIIMLSESPISERKKATALYKLTAGTEFYQMAINNTFEMDESSIIKSLSLKEYVPVVSSTYGITIYKHKNRREYYVSTHREGDVIYGKSKAEKTRFWNKYSYLWFAFLRNDVIFEEYLCLSLFQKLFDNSDD